MRIHLVVVLTEVARVEDTPERLDVLKQYVKAAEAEGRARFMNELDKKRLAEAHAGFLAIAAAQAGTSVPG